MPRNKLLFFLPSFNRARHPSFQEDVPYHPVRLIDWEAVH